MDSYHHDGLRVEVSDSGLQEGDLVIALCNGFPETCRSWDALTPLLRPEHHATTVAPLFLEHAASHRVGAGYVPRAALPRPAHSPDRASPHRAKPSKSAQ